MLYWVILIADVVILITSSGDSSRKRPFYPDYFDIASWTANKRLKGFNQVILGRNIVTLTLVFYQNHKQLLALAVKLLLSTLNTHSTNAVNSTSS